MAEQIFKGIVTNDAQNTNVETGGKGVFPSIFCDVLSMSFLFRDIFEYIFLSHATLNIVGQK